MKNCHSGTLNKRTVTSEEMTVACFGLSLLNTSVRFSRNLTESTHKTSLTCLKSWWGVNQGMGFLKTVNNFPNTAHRQVQAGRRTNALWLLPAPPLSAWEEGEVTGQVRVQRHYKQTSFKRFSPANTDRLFLKLKTCFSSSPCIHINVTVTRAPIVHSQVSFHE